MPGVCEVEGEPRGPFKTPENDSIFWKASATVAGRVWAHHLMADALGNLRRTIVATLTYFSEKPSGVPAEPDPGEADPEGNPGDAPGTVVVLPSSPPVVTSVQRTPWRFVKELPPGGACVVTECFLMSRRRPDGQADWVVLLPATLKLRVASEIPPAYKQCPCPCGGWARDG